MGLDISDKLRDIPLRERKYARTRISLMEAMLEKLRKKSFEDISVKELCETVQISEGTFFNYFPEKKDLILYFIQLWSIEVAAVAQKSAGEKSGLAIIESLFEQTANKMQEGPEIMGEIIALQAKHPKQTLIKEITRAERILAFPDLDNTENIPAGGIGPLLNNALKKAIRCNEIPANTDIDTATLLIASVFFGIPLILGKEAIGAFDLLWKKCLQIIRAGLTNISGEKK